MTEISKICSDGNEKIDFNVQDAIECNMKQIESCLLHFTDSGLQGDL